MRTLTIKSENGSSIKISKSNPYVLQQLEGTGVPKSSKETVKAPNQDGSTHINTTFDDRDLDIKFAILESDFPSLYVLKEEVCKTLNPKYTLDILYEYPGGKKRIKGVLDGEVDFPEGDMIGYQEAKFSIECSNPFWLDDEPSGEKLAVSKPTFRFPLIFSPNITFSVILNKTIKINVKGHVEVPIVIKFNGPALNPVVKNLTTNKFIKVEKELYVGEVLEIRTEKGNKSVMINGENAFGFIDLDSELFYLNPGENIITYDADSGSESAEVSLTYTNRYVGV